MSVDAAQLNKLKVLLCNKFFAPVGGPEINIYEMAKMLEQNGHTAIPFAMQRPDNWPSEYSKYFVSQVDYDESDSVGLLGKLRSAADIIYSRKAAGKIRSLVRDTQPDVAHLHNIYHQLSPSICVALKREGIPMVMTLHDMKLICPNYTCLRNGIVCEECGGRRFHKAVKYRCVKGSRAKSAVCCLEMTIHRLLGLYANNIDLFIAPSEFIRNKFLEYGLLPADRMIHISTAVDTDAYTPTYTNQGYCVYVGRVSEHKGILTLIKAMQANPTIKLRIVGDGDARAKAEQFRDELKLDNIQFDGFQAGDSLRAIIEGASFMIVPSEWYENCPKVVLESFAAGKPVIGSRIGGIPELIQDGVDGLLFEAGSVDELSAKIAELSSDESRLKEMGKACRDKVDAEYTFRDHYQKLLATYRRVIG